MEKQLRGFALLSKAERTKISTRGGIAAHKKGTAHKWTKEEAIKAGRKGGTISRGGRGRIPS